MIQKSNRKEYPKTSWSVRTLELFNICMILLSVFWGCYDIP